MQLAIAIIIILAGGVFFGTIGLYFTLDSCLRDHFELSLIQWLKETKNDTDRDQKLLLWFHENYMTILQTIRAYIIFVFIDIVFVIIILPLIAFFG